MKIVWIVFLVLFVIANVFARTPPRDESRRIKHERIAPSGGFIGFIKEKYYENPKKVRNLTQKIK